MKRVFWEKVNQLRDLYRGKEENGLLIENQNNIAWLLQGRTFISFASVRAVVDLLINDEAVYLIANNIETKRMLEEELLDVGLIVREYPWYEPRKRLEIINELTDSRYSKDSNLEQEIMNLRLIMSDGEQLNLAELGRDAAAAMEASCFQIKRGMSERAAAALMAQYCYERNIEPNILLVAADERIKRYRHPLPTARKINRDVMLVIGGRRNGQCVGLTRYVAFSEPSSETKKVRDAVMQLNALLFTETRPAKNIRDIFRNLIDAYGVAGYPEEWQNHHQGGVIGYNPREIRVDFDTNLLVKAGQAYAWNPSISGFKAEDTFITGEKDNLTVTYTGELPNFQLQYQQGFMTVPDILVRRQWQ